MGRLELWLTTDTGARIAQLSTGLGLSASKVVSGIGWFNYRPPLSFDKSLLKPDRMFQLWYAPDNEALKLWNVYFLRKFLYRSRSIEFGGPDINSLLWRRIVAAYTNSTQAKKSAMEADDMMKEVVSESLLDTADPTPTFGTRAWANLTVQADATLGPQISKSFSFDKLLTFEGGGVLPALAKDAAERGTEVFFWIVPNVVSGDGITFQFRTYINQPGSDVSDQLTFEEESGNLLEPELELDYSREENYIYATGQGVDEDRNVQQVYDETRVGQSIWGRMEGEADSRNQDSNASVTNSGNTALWEGRPKIRFSGKIGNTEGCQFLEHWDVGYRATTKFEVIQFESIIRAATLSVDDSGKIEIDARLDYEA